MKLVSQKQAVCFLLLFALFGAPHAQIFDEFVKKEKKPKEWKPSLALQGHAFYYTTAFFPHGSVKINLPLSRHHSLEPTFGQGTNDHYTYWAALDYLYHFSVTDENRLGMALGVASYWDREYPTEVEHAFHTGIQRESFWNMESTSGYLLGVDAYYRFGRGFRSRPSGLFGTPKISNFAVALKLGLFWEF